MLSISTFSLINHTNQIKLSFQTVCALQAIDKHTEEEQ